MSEQRSSESANLHGIGLTKQAHRSDVDPTDTVVDPTNIVFFDRDIVLKIIWFSQSLTCYEN